MLTSFWVPLMSAPQKIENLYKISKKKRPHSDTTGGYGVHSISPQSGSILNHKKKDGRLPSEI